MASLRLSMIMALGSLLFLCGLVEYVVIMYVHSSRVPSAMVGEGISLEERAWHLDHKRLSMLSQEEEIQNRLKSIGNKGMGAAWEKLSYIVQGDKLMDDSLQMDDSGGGGVAGEGRGHKEAKSPPSSSSIANEAFYTRREELLLKLDDKLNQLDKMHFDARKQTSDDREIGKVDLNLKLYNKNLSAAESERIRELQEIINPQPLEHWIDDGGYHVLEPLVEYQNLSTRRLSAEELKGNNIMMTLRTIKKYHNSRLPLLFSTWLTKVNRSNVFLMTDDRDSVWQRKVWNAGE